jgi:hypothetical protein
MLSGLKVYGLRMAERISVLWRAVENWLRERITTGSDVLTMVRKDEAGERIGKVAESLGCKELPVNCLSEENVMPAIAIAGIAAASSVAGGVMGASASKNAAETAAQGQIDAAKISAQSQEKMYNQTRGDQMPFITGGAAAAGRLGYLLGLPGPQSSTKAAYGAGFGPQGSAYIPSNGGAPVLGYGAPSSTTQLPAPGQNAIPNGNLRGNGCSIRER